MTIQGEVGVHWEPKAGEIDAELYERIKHDFAARRRLTRSVREGLGMSQANAAAMLGLSQSNLSKIEAAAEPRIYILEKLVESAGGRLRLIAEFDEHRALDIVSGEGVTISVDRPSGGALALPPRVDGPK